MNVYILEAAGIGTFVESHVTARSTIAFKSRPQAESWVERFKAKCIEKDRLSGEHPIKVEIIELELIDE